jgi:hypothetical protein
MALGRRCDLGCETWPDDTKYKVCPECGQETTRYKGNNIHPLTEEEATPLRFEAFYKEWDEKMPESRLEMSPTESLKWEELYPDGRPSEPAAEDG